MLQTENDFMNYLKEQIEFLQMSANSYDNGYKSEAKRLAVSIRVLLHDTNQSQSLLKLLNRKNIHFYDSASKYNPENLLSHMGLVDMVFSTDPNESGYIPHLDDLPPYLKTRKKSFKNWWTKQIILEDSEKSPFTRRDIVLSLSNKDGGAHIDPKLNKKYANLSRKDSIGWKFSDGNQESTIFGGELATMRQIAHEVLKTLKDEFPELF
ncbi:hypothetical protein CN902_10995 [Priestia megaterium]|uniref:hypothetical protein n=1 Tax=Priestia megaterium TaxID=1404 RepID=UPI000BFBB69C|nr:hypothetical protein [Priestia megaterium]PGK30628.1 hypothetical protein CN902_10995 [Priestia megaterium]